MLEEGRIAHIRSSCDPFCPGAQAGVNTKMRHDYQAVPKGVTPEIAQEIAKGAAQWMCKYVQQEAARREK